LRWRSLAVFLIFSIFCWVTVIFGGMNSSSTCINREKCVEAMPVITETGFVIENDIFTHHISKWESILLNVRVKYNVRPAFAPPKLVCISSIPFFLLQEYPGNYPARAAPEPKGPL
jgi:hypothetical protein